MRESNVKRLIWLYFWLLILEGAFRKWILPGLSTPLLLVRDPVVLGIYFLAMAEGRFPRSPFIPWIGGLAAACFFASFAGQGALKVTLYGLHTDFLHLPLVFVVAEYFDMADVRKMGKWLLMILLPMAALAVLQFRAGPDSRVNVGVGGEVGGQLWAAANKVRASGTFSFVTGLVSFLALTAAYLFHDFLERGVYPKLLVLAAIPALVLALGVSGSRSAVLGVTVVFASGALVCLKRWEKFGPAFMRVLLIFIVYLGLTQMPTFREGLEVQKSRFSENGGMKVGIVDRYFGGFSDAWVAMGNAPVFGYGLGVGTNAGASMITGIRAFLLAEGEWPRVILESGPILGLFYLLLRTSLIIHAFRRGWSSLEAGHSLPILLLGMSGLEMFTGQFGQPTSLGFAALGMGLTLASNNLPAAFQSEEIPDPPSHASLRGRSRYAESLHGHELEKAALISPILGTTGHLST